MADLREVVQREAPDVGEVDLGAITRRAHDVRQADQRRRRWQQSGIAAAVVLLIVGAFAVPRLLAGEGRGAVLQDGPSAPSATAPVGGFAFTGVDLDGAPVSSADFAGEPMVITVWAPWCGPCAQSVADFLAAVPDMPEGVVPVAVAVRDDPERVADQAVAHGLDVDGIVNVVMREDTALWAPLDPIERALPLTVAVNAAGEVVGWVQGGAPTSKLQDMAEDALVRTEPNPAGTVYTSGVVPVPDATTEFRIRTFPPSPGALEGPGDIIPSPIPDEGFWYPVQPGDTLATIAERAYGDPTAFGPIAEANDLTGGAPLQGQRLLIPPPDG